MTGFRSKKTSAIDKLKEKTMSELAYDIEQLYIDGLSPREIATQLECPVSFVYDWLTEQGVAETQQEQFSPYNGA